MKNAFVLGFSLLVLFGFGINVSHSGGDAGSASREFNKGIKSNYELYSVSDSSGCTTTIKVWDTSRQVELRHGEGCQASIGNSVEVAASNFKEILNAYDLVKQIRKAEVLMVEIGAHIANEPLILYLNSARNWPDNYVDHFKAKAKSRDKAIEMYREHLRNTILESGLYAPVFYVAKEIGCDAKLSQDLFDPLFFDKHEVSGKDLVEWGVIGNGEAMKGLFPSAKGGLEFEINCASRDN